jgi:hypothetical protein
VGARSVENTRTVTVKQLVEACASRKHEGRFVLSNSQMYTVRAQEPRGLGFRFRLHTEMKRNRVKRAEINKRCCDLFR